eukprot:Rhum_TRINITY_DN14648_c18_g1::Rhum_TRINITY_DN14648_c18_g1_i1::g.107626::m.107626/K00921/PIKFYVE, FAB1; 1-phosphatidylinositol-3-phosphate 5-kinase
MSCKTGRVFKVKDLEDATGCAALKLIWTDLEGAVVSSLRGWGVVGEEYANDETDWVLTIAKIAWQLSERDLARGHRNRVASELVEGLMMKQSGTAAGAAGDSASGGGAGAAGGGPPKKRTMLAKKRTLSGSKSAAAALADGRRPPTLPLAAMAGSGVSTAAGGAGGNGPQQSGAGGGLQVLLIGSGDAGGVEREGQCGSLPFPVGEAEVCLAAHAVVLPGCGTPDAYLESTCVVLTNTVFGPQKQPQQVPQQQPQAPLCPVQLGAHVRSVVAKSFVPDQSCFVFSSPIPSDVADALGVGGGRNVAVEGAGGEGIARLRALLADYSASSVSSTYNDSPRTSPRTISPRTSPRATSPPPPPPHGDAPGGAPAVASEQQQQQPPRAERHTTDIHPADCCEIADVGVKFGCGGGADRRKILTVFLKGGGRCSEMLSPEAARSSVVMLPYAGPPESIGQVGRMLRRTLLSAVEYALCLRLHLRFTTALYTTSAPPEFTGRPLSCFLTRAIGYSAECHRLSQDEKHHSNLFPFAFLSFHNKLAGLDEPTGGVGVDNKYSRVSVRDYLLRMSPRDKRFFLRGSTQVDLECAVLVPDKDSGARELPPRDGLEIRVRCATCGLVTVSRDRSALDLSFAWFLEMLCQEACRNVCGHPMQSCQFLIKFTSTGVGGGGGGEAGGGDLGEQQSHSSPGGDGGADDGAVGGNTRVHISVKSNVTLRGVRFPALGNLIAAAPHLSFGRAEHADLLFSINEVFDLISDTLPDAEQGAAAADPSTGTSSERSRSTPSSPTARLVGLLSPRTSGAAGAARSAGASRGALRAVAQQRAHFTREAEKCFMFLQEAEARYREAAVAPQPEAGEAGAEAEVEAAVAAEVAEAEGVSAAVVDAEAVESEDDDETTEEVVFLESFDGGLRSSAAAAASNNRAAAAAAAAAAPAPQPSRDFPETTEDLDMRSFIESVCSSHDGTSPHDPALPAHDARLPAAVPAEPVTRATVPPMDSCAPEELEKVVHCISEMNRLRVSLVACAEQWGQTAVGMTKARVPPQLRFVHPSPFAAAAAAAGPNPHYCVNLSAPRESRVLTRPGEVTSIFAAASRAAQRVVCPKVFGVYTNPDLRRSFMEALFKTMEDYTKVTGTAPGGGPAATEHVVVNLVPPSDADVAGGGGGSGGGGGGLLGKTRRRRKTLDGRSGAEAGHEIGGEGGGGGGGTAFACPPIKCTVYCVKKFAALQRVLEERSGCRGGLAASLSRCERWTAQGGKSGAAFVLTSDGKFIAKEITTGQLKQFEATSKEYFAYVSHSLRGNMLSCLAKILGVFKVSVAGGSEQAFILQENIFYPERPGAAEVFDLKGAMRNRIASPSSSVKLDGDLMAKMVHGEFFAISKNAAETLHKGVYNDTLLLSRWGIMDYSMIALVHPDRPLISVGIVDYLQAFTRVKRAECLVKGFISDEACIVHPQKYKDRFRQAVAQYFVRLQ